MARAQKFEREEMLDRALEVFWNKGYEAASVQELGDAMGVYPGTLYHAFGGKHALYLEVLDRYERTAGDWPIATLNGRIDKKRASSGKASIRYLFEATAEFLSTADGRRGCLMANAGVERGLCDPEVAARVSLRQSRLEDALYQALFRAQEAGELRSRSEKQLRALSRFLNATLQGMGVVARSASTSEALHDVAKLAIAALD